MSEWLTTATTTTGERIAVGGGDLWEFRGDQIVRKASYWTIVTERVPANTVSTA